MRAGGVAATHRSSEEGPRWHQLKPAQREALKPLESDWSGLDSTRKQKWLRLSDRIAKMQPEERERVQARMNEWAHLSPSERGRARLRYEEAKGIPISDRRSRWEAYQALPDEQKRALADKAAADRNAAMRRTGNAHLRERKAGVAHDPSSRKSSTAPQAPYPVHSRPIGPTELQVAPGATTTLITRRPPPHPHSAVPKIAGTPEFVDKSTLLPRRTPQRPVSPDTPTQPRR